MGSWSETILGGDAPLDCLCELSDALGVRLDDAMLGGGTPDEASPEEIAKAAAAFDAVDPERLSEIVRGFGDEEVGYPVAAQCIIRVGARLPSEIAETARFLLAIESPDSWSDPIRRKAKLLELCESIAAYDGTPRPYANEPLFSKFGRSERVEETSDSRLLSALLAVDRKGASAEIARGADLDGLVQNPASPRCDPDLILNVLLKNGCHEGFRIAVDLGADPTLRPPGGLAPIHAAASLSSARLESFWPRGVDPKAPTPFGVTALEIAAASSVENFRFLLDLSDPLSPEEASRCAMLSTATRRAEDAVFLYAAADRAFRWGSHSLPTAVAVRGDEACVQALFDAGFDLTETRFGETSGQIARRCFGEEAAKLLDRFALPSCESAQIFEATKPGQLFRKPGI